MAEELIAVNQDPLGIPGDLIWKQGANEVCNQPCIPTSAQSSVILGSARLLAPQRQAESSGKQKGSLTCCCQEGRGVGQ